jgi:protein gp37
VTASAIEWTDRSDWNPVRGCSITSPGCRNCYAMKMASRFSGPGEAFDGYARDGKWTGLVRLHAERLAMPLGWRRPGKVFANSMSDLFHESLSNDDIAAVFGAMAAAPRQTFQVLTKRAARMLEWFRWFREELPVDGHRHIIPAMIEHAAVTAHKAGHQGVADRLFRAANDRAGESGWPLPNVWLGVSVESQKYADERIPDLLACPAAVHFVSGEPLLESIGYAVRGYLLSRDLEWVIVGGESGRGARPFNVTWARELVTQCRAAGVPVFVKQLGADIRATNDEGWEQLFGDEGDERTWPIEDIDAVEHSPNGYREEHQGAEVRVHLWDAKGGDPEEWPADLRVREFPEEARTCIPE